MAPLLRIMVQWLPNLPGTVQLTDNPKDLLPSFNGPDLQQQVFRPGDAGNVKSDDQYIRSPLSSVSWAEGRLDIFSLAGNNLTHKWWDGHQWNPDDLKLETLGNRLTTAPVAISWGIDRLDIIGLDDYNVIKHQFWDGSSW